MKKEIKTCIIISNSSISSSKKNNWLYIAHQTVSASWKSWFFDPNNNYGNTSPCLQTACRHLPFNS